MKWIRDRLALVMSAVSLLAVLLGGAFLLERLHFRSVFIDLWVYTLFLFLVIVVSGVNELNRRRKRLHRVWPLVVAVLLLLVVHLIAMGVLIDVTGRQWRMPEYLLATVIELFIAVAVLERVYASCTKSPSVQQRT